MSDMLCPNCGGEVVHREEKEDGYILDRYGNKKRCFLPCDDYICKKCGAVQNLTIYCNNSTNPIEEDEC